MALKYSKMAVWELDLTKRSIIRSDGFDQLFGYTQDGNAWTQEDLLVMFLPEDQRKFREMLATIKPDQNFDFQGRIRTEDGIIKWINFQGKADQGRILETLYDITRDKLAEREKDDSPVLPTMS